MDSAVTAGWKTMALSAKKNSSLTWMMDMVSGHFVTFSQMLNTTRFTVYWQTVKSDYSASKVKLGSPASASEAGENDQTNCTGYYKSHCQDQVIECHHCYVGLNDEFESLWSYVSGARSSRTAQSSLFHIQDIPVLAFVTRSVAVPSTGLIVDRDWHGHRSDVTRGSNLGRIIGSIRGKRPTFNQIIIIYWRVLMIDPFDEDN